MVFKVAINCQQPVGKRTWPTSYTTAPSDLIVVKATCMYCNAPQLQGNGNSCQAPKRLATFSSCAAYCTPLIVLI